MMERFGFTMRDLEIKGYGSAASISNKLKLLDLTEPVQKKIQSGELSIAHGLQLVRLPNKKEQERMAKRVIDEDLSAKRTERQIGRYLSKGKQKDERPPAQIPDTDIPGVYIKDSRDMRELPDESVHLIVSSPPYGVGMEYEKGVTFDEHIEIIQGVLKECARVLVKGGIMGLNVGDIHCFKARDGKKEPSQVEMMGHRYQTWLRRYGIFLTDVIIWLKRMPSWTKRPDIHFTDVAHTAYKLLPNFEPVYIFRKKGEREVPDEDVVLKSRLTKEEWVAWTPSVWNIKPVQNMEGHPSIYPDELCLRLIKMFSYEGDTVLDPWLGSGTTIKVARELNRVGIGYEKEAQYKEVIMRRLGISSKADEHKEVDKKIGILQEAFASATDGEEHFPDLVKVKDEQEKEKPSVEHADDYLEAEVGAVA
jgi:DNA modification methylase